MKSPLLLAWLSGLGPYWFRSESYIEDLLKNSDSQLALPPLEVLPSQVPKTKPFSSHSLTLEGGFTLFKCQLDQRELANLESAHGNFEGGLRLSKSAVELVNTLRREIRDGQLSFRGKRVLELGCGHGLPGVLACIKGAAVVHFQDLSAEVLRCVTIPNVRANLEHAQSQHTHPSGDAQVATKTSQFYPELHYYAGDWSCMESMLSSMRHGDADSAYNFERDGPNANWVTERLVDTNSGHVVSGRLHGPRRVSSGRRACERGDLESRFEGGYDIILMSDTVYAAHTLPMLYSLIRMCLRPPYGVMYMAGKKYSTGYGGGTRQFKSLADADGLLGAHLIAGFTDTSFNTKEVWKYFFH